MPKIAKKQTIAVAARATDAGICAQTQVMTARGGVMVEALVVGDRVVTRDGGFQELRAITAEDVKMKPVRIKAGSLGHTRPDVDTLVPRGTRIHIRDWRATVLFGAAFANVAARRLADGEFIAVQPTQQVTVYTLGFDREEVIYAGGMEIVVDAVAA